MERGPVRIVSNRKTRKHRNERGRVTEALLEKSGVRPYLTRFIQFFLGLDGLLHGLEVISAYYEEAWTTFALTSFHACIFFFAAYFVGHDHSHHRKPEGENGKKSSLWKNILFALLLLLVLLIFTPLGEFVLPESLHIFEGGHDH